MYLYYYLPSSSRIVPIQYVTRIAVASVVPSTNAVQTRLGALWNPVRNALVVRIQGVVIAWLVVWYILVGLRGLADVRGYTATVRCAGSGIGIIYS